MNIKTLILSSSWHLNLISHIIDVLFVIFFINTLKWKLSFSSTLHLTHFFFLLAELAAIMTTICVLLHKFIVIKLSLIIKNEWIFHIRQIILHLLISLWNCYLDPLCIHFHSTNWMRFMNRFLLEWIVDLLFYTLLFCAYFWGKESVIYLWFYSLYQFFYYFFLWNIYIQL